MATDFEIIDVGTARNLFNGVWAARRSSIGLGGVGGPGSPMEGMGGGKVRRDQAAYKLGH